MEYRQEVETFRDVFRNLNDVLREFQGSNEQMSIQNFMTILKGIRFDAVLDYDLSIPEKKLRIVYQLGVITFYIINRRPNANTI